MKYIAILLVSFLTLLSTKETSTIKVKITGFKSIKGKCLVSLHNLAASFPAKPDKAMQSKNVVITDDGTTVVFENLPNGTYAIAVVHDENDNKKMDTNFFGIPKEGYGVSNNKYPKMSEPSFDDAKFTLKEDKEISIKMKY